ncbi:Zinc finger and SCAN domain-containing protein 22 [Pseudolycoriella hygida]|uniref:Zinc finger and SCAN domain-containing protein 22 n=1 Tax=Pseudolycoriella hygida TaxID=35572 RepID=A0A9Q0MQX3_9DIPT|nr:Zinc finger and SCAN domain-containing protein 22 [Pseudolycoriella hygida]
MSKPRMRVDLKNNISPQKDLQDNTLRIMENLLSSCRLCLTTFTDGQSIIDLFEGDGANRSFSLIATDLTSLTMTKDDMYPNNICESCASQLAIFDSFRTSCQLSFKKLQAIVPLGMSIRDSRKQKLTAEYIFDNDGNDVSMEAEGSINDDEILVQLCDYEPTEANESQTDGNDQNETDDLIELTIKTEADESGNYVCQPYYVTEGVDVQTNDEAKQKRKRAPKVSASERKLNCDICKITFNRGHDFTRHQMSHAGIKEFSCDLCHQQFTRRSHLNSHMMIHNQIKPFSCDVCGFMFRKLSNLHRHMSVHSNIYNYECTLCDKKFKRMPSLRLHQKIHEGGCTLTCTFCGKVYASYSGFKKHLLKHKSKENAEVKTMNEDVEVLFEEYLITEDGEAIET